MSVPAPVQKGSPVIRPKAIPPKDRLHQLPPPQSPVSTPGLPSAAAAAASAMRPLVLLPSQTAPALPSSSTPVNSAAELCAVSTPNPSTPKGDATTSKPNAKSSEKSAKKERSTSDIDSQGRLQIQNYLHTVSGQLKLASIQELEHDYAKPCHNHPDPTVRSHAAKFLFMKNFPRHLNKPSTTSARADELVDIMGFEEQKKIPFLTPRPPSAPVSVDEDIPELDSSITDSWTCEMNKLWTRANKIIYTDRIARLTCEGNVNEVLLKRNLQEQTANKFRELFASTFWDSKLVTWLHGTLLEHLNYNFKSVYLDSLQILKHKIPSLIDTFYREPKTENKAKPFLNDPLFNTLSHYKLKKLPRKPVFIIIPNGPHSSHQSVRIKYWHSMFSAMGKVVTIPINGKGIEYVVDILSEIRYAVNEKIRNAKTMFSNRPLILVGFHYGSLIAAQCALQNPKSICATICLGFPIRGINGIRGDLEDPLLETTVPTQFIIGENAVMTTLDDIEDFRERLTKTETSLVVVGGADDKLVVSNLKKRLDCLTQSMVDRCVADEIFSFLANVLINYSEDIAALDHPKVSVIPSQPNQSADPFATPKTTKKKPTKKKTPPGTFAENAATPTVFGGGANGMQPSDGQQQLPPMKPPPKRKRPPPKPKTPKPSPINGSSPLIIPNSTLISPSSLATMQQPQPYPNLAGVLTHGMLPSDSPALKQLANKFILQEPSKMETQPMSATPVATNKKGTKKLAVASLAMPSSNLPGSLSTISEEGMLQTQQVIPATLDPTALSAFLKTSTANSHLSTAMNPLCHNGIASLGSTSATASSQHVSATGAMTLTEGSSTVHTTTSSSSSSSYKSDAVYSLTETPLIHQSTTRTGRPIIPPKSLDI